MAKECISSVKKIGTFKKKNWYISHITKWYINKEEQVVQRLCSRIKLITYSFIPALMCLAS